MSRNCRRQGLRLPQLTLGVYVHLVVTLVVIHVVAAQNPEETADEYGRRIAGVNQVWSTERDALESIAGQLNRLSAQFQQSVVDNNQVQSSRGVQEFLVYLKSIERSVLSVPSSVSGPPGSDYRKGRLQRQEAGELVVLLSQLSQLQFAQGLVDQRQRQTLLEISRVSKEISEVNGRLQRCFEEYRLLADTFGTRTKQELEAALGELGQLPTLNIGARFLRAATLRRLGQFAEAERELNDLSKLPTTYRALFVAARAESLALLGDERESKKLLGSLRKQVTSNADLAIYEGLTRSVFGDWQEAIGAWEIALRSSEWEVLVRRNLAIVLATSSRGIHDRKHALEQAELASKLSLRQNWSVELALSIALIANDDAEGAKLAAQAAQDLTSGDCAEFCSRVQDEIGDAKIPKWNFRRF